MAKEIQFTDATGFTDYVNLIDATGQWYNTVGAAFEAFNAANWTDYDIAATEYGTNGTYSANMPSVPSGFYNLIARRRAGGAPAQTDSIIGSGDMLWDDSFGTVAVVTMDGFFERSAGNYSSANAFSVVKQIADNAASNAIAAIPADTADKLLGRNLAGGSDGGRMVKDALRAARNKVAFDVPLAGQFTVFAEDDITPAWTGTYTATPGASPVTVMDPT